MAYNLNVSFVDVCLPCFLTDHHNREGECLIGVVVSGTTSVKSVKDVLFWEAWRAESIPALSEDPEEEKTILRNAINASLANREDSEAFDSTLPIEDDDCDMEELVQAWFVFTWK